MLRSLLVSVVAFGLVGPLSPVGAQDSICARVEIQIDQRIVVTRAAFRASLGVGNETSDLLEDFDVDLEIRATDGSDASHLFAGLTMPSLAGFSGGDLNGTADLGPGADGEAIWILVPTENAAPGVDPVTYTVGGRVRHKQTGIQVEIPLFPVEIDVYPDAALFLDYYLQRVVYADNPFTSGIVEPSEPFALGLIIRNEGNGDALNLRITSSQPEITANDQQLAIEFEMLGAQIGSEPIQPSLALNFGDLPSGENRVARWLMTSTVQGLFTCIAVNFEHVTNLGSDAISLIKDADIFWQLHTVELDSPFLPASVAASLDDGLPDFLVDDDPAQPTGNTGEAPVCGGSLADDVPDSVHSSEGSILSVVTGAEVATPEAPSLMDLSVKAFVTVTLPGWNYVRFPDPARYNGVYPATGADDPPAVALVQMTRRDRWKERKVGEPPMQVTYAAGGAGDIGNLWTTSRKAPLDGPPTSFANEIHYFDYFAAPGRYRLDLDYAAVSPLLVASDEVLSLAKGGVIELQLEAGPEHAGRPYQLVGSTAPPLGGTLLGDVRIPLRRDAYTDAVLRGQAGAVLQEAQGNLDAAGRALARLTLPSDCRWFAPGTKLVHAFVVGDQDHVTTTSNGIETVLLP